METDTIEAQQPPPPLLPKKSSLKNTTTTTTIPSLKKNPHADSKSKKPSASQIQRAKMRREQVLKQTRKEKRFMLVASLAAAVGIFVWTVAIATDGWYATFNKAEVVDQLKTNGTTTLLSDNETNDNENDGEILIESHTGLWRSCRVVVLAGGGDEEEVHCKYFKLFPSREEMKRMKDSDEHVIDYRRTQLTFALLSLFLMLLSLLAAFYTFKNGRYMYKRLASGLYFISAACILVTMEAVITCLRHELANIPLNFPPGSETIYNYAFYMGWSVFLIYLVNGSVFLIYSRKKKWVIDEEEDNKSAS